ncbi:hypothetical protein [Alteromonas macleodii]|uniref:hypothetical protein n=1 Tax=Alteromonas macleodii TaxID=28108 RepID=UPI002FE0FDA0
MVLKEIASNAKDVFVFIGAAAGLIAFLKPMIEPKYNKDIERLQNLLKRLDTQEFTINEMVYHASARRIPHALVLYLGSIEHDVEENTSDVRFTGPMKSIIMTELKSFIRLNKKLREFVHVPQWQTDQHRDNYEFQKDWFDDNDKDYVQHINGVELVSEQLVDQYRRLELLTEIPALEAMLSPDMLINRKLNRYHPISSN